MRYGIDRYLRVQGVVGMTWMKGGRSLVYLSDVTGSPQIWRVAQEGGFPEQLTYFNERVGALAVLPDSNDIFFYRDEGGNENMQIYRLKLDGSDPENLTQCPEAMHQLGGLAKGRTLVFSSNARNKAHFDLCSLDLVTGERRIMLQNEDNYNTPAALSPDGRYLLYVKLRGSDNRALWYYDMHTGVTRPIGSGKIPVGSNPNFCADSRSFYFLTNLGSEFNYIAHYDIPRNYMRVIYDEQRSLEGMSLSPDGRYLAFTVNDEGYSTLRVLDLKTNACLPLPAMENSKGVMGNLEWSPDSSKIALLCGFDCQPMDVYILDLQQQTLRRLTYSSRCGIQDDGFVAPELHRFTSFDGLSVPTWVYRPHGSKGAMPVVISIHGGPEGQSRPAFNPVQQYLINQGIAVVAPNVRGSTGYGNTYQHLDDVEKRMDSVADIEALVKYLVAEGIADPKHIAVMGGSYGGFMTLACITEYPDLWAAAVDTVGIANFETFLERTSSYRRAHRESEYGSLEKHRDVLRRVSPIHKVDRIVAPLMVIHGANDPRVPIHEAEQIVANLKERNREVLYLRYEDEGHGVVKLANRLDCYPQVAAFLRKHLGIED